VSNKFTAFYNQDLVWVRNKEDYSKLDLRYSTYYEQMSKTVIDVNKEKFSIKVSFDGLIMLRINDIEDKIKPTNKSSIFEDITLWNEYITYINAFNILLTLNSISFNLKQLKMRDVFRIFFSEGRIDTSNLTDNTFNHNCFSARYKIEPEIEIDSLYIRTNKDPSEIMAVIDLFHNCFENKKLISHLASLNQSIGDFKEGDYESSIISSWFISENILNHYWLDYIESKNINLEDGSKTINRDRKKFLKNQNIGLIISLLELQNIIPYDLYKDLEKARDVRNNIAHSHKTFTSTYGDAKNSIQCCIHLFNSYYEIEVNPSLGISSAILNK